MIQQYYNEVAGRQITTGLVLSHQTFGDFARPNPHWHGLLLEGGFDDNGNFVYLPIASIKQMAELFRRKMIWYFEKNKLLNTDFALNLLSWGNSGFSIDNSVRIYGSDNKARESLSQYIARTPFSLEKLRYEPFHGKVLFKTPRYNDYFKENFKPHFIPKLRQFHPEIETILPLMKNKSAYFISIPAGDEIGYHGYHRKNRHETEKEKNHA